jgi:RNA polymerase sigma-70 factor (ECF subfamily)
MCYTACLSPYSIMPPCNSSLRGTASYTYMTSHEDQERNTRMTDAHNDYNKGLNRHSFFKIHNHTLSEDLVQDTFIKTWQYLVRGGKIEMMKAFLYHILNNLIIDEYRKQKTVSLDMMLENGFEPTNTDTDRVMNIFDGKTALLLIKHLPLKYQKVIRMRFAQDLTLHEMSLLTGQSKNTLAVQIHRALAKLRLLYGGTK